MALFGDQMGGEEQAAMKAVKHRASSRGDVIEVDGKTYQPTGPLDQRGFASLTRTNPSLQTAIAAKGGAHSHQGDPGVDQGRQDRYHSQDPQLDQQIASKGGTPGAAAKKAAARAFAITKRQQDNADLQGAVKGVKAGGENHDQLITKVMQTKNVDRPVAERVVARAMR